MRNFITAILVVLLSLPAYATTIHYVDAESLIIDVARQMRISSRINDGQRQLAAEFSQKSEKDGKQEELKPQLEDKSSNASVFASGVSGPDADRLREKLQENRLKLTNGYVTIIGSALFDAITEYKTQTGVESVINLTTFNFERVMLSAEVVDGRTEFYDNSIDNKYKDYFMQAIHNEDAVDATDKIKKIMQNKLLEGGYIKE